MKKRLAVMCVIFAALLAQSMQQSPAVAEDTGGTVRVTVVDASGKTMQGAAVGLYRETPKRLLWVRTSDERGRATFSGVPAGSVYMVLISAEGYEVVRDRGLRVIDRKKVERRYSLRRQKPSGV